MEKQKFNNGWEVESGVKDAFAVLMERPNRKPVTLPHDAMIEEKRSADCANGNQTGYYPSKSYTYTKKIIVPKDWEQKQVLLEFEGVMSKALVYVNEEYAARHAYGYSQFYVDIKPYLNYGEENEIKVIAINNDKSSRWYSGSGIYRDVNLHLGGMTAMVPEQMKITTQDIEEDYAVLTVDTAIKNVDARKYEGKLHIQFLDQDERVVAEECNGITIQGGQTINSHMRIIVPSPSLWSTEHPYLYQCKATLGIEDEISDEASEFFGIRKLQLDAKKGLRINGESIKLRGACIHHDNGVIGACTLEKAEEFRVKKLKEAGFNSIRSAHHPMSKVMLRVCDRLGILVMDELADMWNVPKNSNDASFDFPEIWKDEVKQMIAKDYNHPCVVLYSVGNELPEIGRSGGRIQCREIANVIRENDATRYVTSGFNGFLALSGVSKEDGLKMAQMFAAPQADGWQQEKTSIQNDSESSSDGSEKLNDVMGDIPYEIRDMLHGSDLMTKQIDEVGDELDVIGLNYMPVRHELEHELHPNHVIVGSESYPTEIARLWGIVESKPYVIGDFTWTGYDYLGEAGIGIYHYDCMPEGQGVYPDRLAYCGDINLNGYRRPASYLKEIAFGLRKEPFISVERVNRYGYGCLRNHWKYDDALDSWTYPGYEGQPAKLKILSPSEEVELFVNGRSLGRKKAGKENEFTAQYELNYEPGELLAVAYDQEIETARTVLKTAKQATQIQCVSTADSIVADGQDAVILDLYLTDEDGIPNMWEKHMVHVNVEGAAVLAGLGNADPSSENSYQDSCCETFDGRVLAVIRSNGNTGDVKVQIQVEGMEEKDFLFHASEK
ncbi:MAG: glycoside hydrolase family 2 TIM barrel-domain containing protein [Lachnospiraceae bacterium]|nr:glycoside hydrolase family 2 TIM barrel-domain containing protein [Lachnospiraceae bacterium]